MFDCLFLLFLLLLLVHRLSDELEEFLVLDFVFGLEKSLVNWKSSQSGGLSFGDHDGDFELSDDCSGFLNQNWVGN